MSDNANTVTDSAEPGRVPGLSIALIGHQGRMGAMLMRRWQAAGFAVRGADRADPAGGRRPTFGNAIPVESLDTAVQGADVAILAVPVAAFPPVLCDLVPLLKPEQVLADIASVKMLPMRQMERRHCGPVVGTHPLFGPDPLPEDLVTAVTPGARATEAHIRMVEGLFTRIGCRTFRTTPEEHDRGAAFVQGLNFVSSAAYLASLARREEIMPFLTPSFRRRLESARKLLTEDAEMFQGFTSANPMTADAIHTFRLFLDLVESDGLPDVVAQARWWYGGSGERG